MVKLEMELMFYKCNSWKIDSYCIEIVDFKWVLYLGKG
jgi:hypothetical protein